MSQKRIAVLVLCLQNCYTGLSSTYKIDVSGLILDRNDSGGNTGEKNSSRGENSPRAKKGDEERRSHLLGAWSAEPEGPHVRPVPQQPNSGSFDKSRK